MKKALAFLNQIKQLSIQPHTQTPELLALGPTHAPMEKKEHAYRAQLLLQAPKRTTLHKTLKTILHTLESRKMDKNITWSVDVDPLDLY